MLAKQGAVVVVADVNEEKAAKIVMNLPTGKAKCHERVPNFLNEAKRDS